MENTPEYLQSIEKGDAEPLLNELEVSILRKRFGLDTGGVPMGLAEVGEEYGMTREEVRVTELQAIYKVRSL